MARLSKYSRLVPSRPEPLAMMLRRFLGADVGKAGASRVHHEGQAPRPVPCGVSTRPEHGNIGFADHLPHPQDLGLAIDGVRRDAQRKALALAALIQGRHQRRLLLRPAADLDLEAEAPVEALSVAA